MFLSQIVRKIYHIRNYENISHEVHKEEGSEDDEQARKKVGGELRNKGKTSEEDNFQMQLKIAKRKEDDIAEDFKHKHKVHQPEINNLLFAFLNRQRLKYTAHNIVQFICRCMCLRSLSGGRRSRELKKHYLF